MSSRFKKLGFGAKQVVRHTGKGATEQALPNRRALNTLTKGDPAQRTINNYAKETPGLGMPSPTMLDFAQHVSDDDFG